MEVSQPELHRNPPPYRVLQLTTAEGWRGGEQQLFYLITRLHSLGVHVELCCPQAAVIRKRLEGWDIPIHTFSGRGILNLNIARKVLKLCRRGTYHLIHTHDSHSHGAAYLAALAGCPLPIVVSRRVDFPAGRSLLSSAKYNHPKIVKILCVSDAIKQVMATVIHKKDKLMTIHSGVDTGRFPHREKTGKLNLLLGLEPGTPLVGNTSALAFHKDYPTFLRTALRIHAQRPDVHFVIIGDGPERAAIEKQIATSGLAGCVHLTGFREDIPDLLPDLDVFFMPSIKEGLGTSVLDAFTCSVPVVSTRTGGIPEMVRHDESGLLAEVGDDAMMADHILRILGDANLRRHLQLGGEQILADFSMEAMADKTAMVYQDVYGTALGGAG